VEDCRTIGASAQTTKFVSYEQVPTLSTIIMPLIMNTITHHLKAAPPIVTAFKSDLVNDLIKCQGILQSNAGNTLLMGVYLDPQFKSFYFINDPNERQANVDSAAAYTEHLLSSSNTSKSLASSPTKPPLPSSSPLPAKKARSSSSSYMQEMAALFGNEAIASAKPSTLHNELNHYCKKPNVPLFLTLPQQQEEPDATTDEEPTLTNPLTW